MALEIILIASDDDVHQAVLSSFTNTGDDIDIRLHKNTNDALVSMVSDFSGVCVVRIRSDTIQDILGFLEESVEAGVHTPIIILMDMVSDKLERTFIENGAMAAIPWDGTQEAILRNVIRLAIKMRSVEEKLRLSNNQLSEDLVNSRSQREWAEQQNAEIIELAENLSLANDRLARLNAEKTKLFSVIAHDLRSPFNTLLGFTEILASSVEVLSRDKISDYAIQTNNSGQQVYRLLENLLEWAQIEMDGLKVVPQKLHLDELILESVDIYRDNALEKGIELTSESGDLEVYADPNLLKIVLRNLINNSVKFSESGDMVKIKAQKGNNGKIIVEVLDTGVGMDEDQLKGIFSLLKSVNSTGTSGESGTGLGLHLCKEFVEKNGGHISVNSAKNEGTSFIFTVPSAN